MELRMGMMMGMLLSEVNYSNILVYFNSSARNGWIPSLV
jgi:hypothetical protein